MKARWIIGTTLVLVCGLAVAGSHQVNIDDASSVQAATTLKQDRFSSGPVYFGPSYTINYDKQPIAPTRDSASIFLDAGEARGIVVYNLQASISYTDTDWHFYDGATFVGGEPAQLHRLGEGTIQCHLKWGCTFTEDVSVQLGRSFLDEHLAHGFSIAIDSKAGDRKVIDVPASSVQGFLAALPTQTFPASSSTSSSLPDSAP